MPVEARIPVVFVQRPVGYEPRQFRGIFWLSTVSGLVYDWILDQQPLLAEGFTKRGPVWVGVQPCGNEMIVRPAE